MKTRIILPFAAVFAGLVWTVAAAQISLESAPPVVVRTVPVAGATDVDPGLTEIKVTYSKTMQDGSWSWSTWGKESFPEMVGKPKYLADGRTCVLTVKLQPDKFYATWLNSDKFHNFKDASGRSAVPYLLTFKTADSDAGGRAGSTDGLNEHQRTFQVWTDRHFRSFFDNRTFDGWSGEDVRNLETKMVDALNGPRTREYYLAINTLGALRSTNALPRLRQIAFERVDKDNRDRWMAVRVLGIIRDRESIPEFIHLVYHGNVNTRWWAQISLVRLTGQNFGSDWKAWGEWWNKQDGQPPYDPAIIRWYDSQAEPDKLAQSLAESDRRFFEKLQ